jgi:hypothetical protein
MAIVIIFIMRIGGGHGEGFRGLCGIGIIFGRVIVGWVIVGCLIIIVTLFITVIFVGNIFTICFRFILVLFL